MKQEDEEKKGEEGEMNGKEKFQKGKSEQRLAQNIINHQ